MPISRIGATRAVDVENRRAFCWIAFLDGEARSEPILTRGGRGEALLHLTLRVSHYRILLNFLLLDASIVPTGEFENNQLSFCADDWISCQSRSGNRRFHHLPGTGVATVRPQHDFERFARGDDRAGATFFAAGGIHHAGLDGVFRIHVAVDFLCRRSVDFDLRRAIRADR